MILNNISKFVNQLIHRNRISFKIIVLYGVIALSLMAPMASSTIIPSINDTPSHISYIVQARDAINEGQFPLRIAPLEDNGWRYPGFQFYSQLPYFIGGWFYKLLTPNNPYDAYKLVIIISLTMGGLYVYFLSLKLTRSRIASILSGVAYMSAPYFLNNIHARGAFTETVAQGILPIVIYYALECYLTRKKRYFVLSALSWFCLSITHIITFIYGTIFIFFLLVIVITQTRKTKFSFPSLVSLLKAYILGWLLGLYFLAPIILVSPYLSIRKQIKAINPFGTNTYTPIANLFSPVSLPAEPSENGLAATYGLHPAIGWIFLIAFGIVIYYRYFTPFNPPKLKLIRPYIDGLLCVFLLALFLTWSPINIWNILPRQLWVTQFTFRFITHIMWAGALLTAYAIVLIFRERLDRRHLIIGILLIILFGRSWIPAPRGTLTVNKLVEEPLFKYSGSLDYLYRAPVKTIYGKNELPLLHPEWIPGYSTWNTFVNHPLILDAELRYPIWDEKENPIIFLEAEISPINIEQPIILEAYIDGRKISSVFLNSPKLNWQIPLPKISPSSKDFGLKFVLNDVAENKQLPNIRVNRFFLEGMSPEKTIIPVSETQQYCKQEGINTVCELVVGEEAQIAQLPVLYYPNMFKLWVDNKPFKESFPVHYRDYSLVGLKLKTGSHIIKTTFNGLVWANWISGLTWLILAIYIITPLYKDLKKESLKSRNNSYSKKLGKD
ncbi:6-pyruvoyl-tetrahydropterin synthase-related protein [Candidatus Atelocyanobacterium thalassae]|uniref:Membrane protein 6-pyruvoyl-tetrahydropterin synthase-related domain-containing protein n=1 Tax=cyanobacterium endosymbiont of Braarudosphaera bigelowii TaxID=1285375 RepID=A0ABN6K407_9CHRO|nr:6-pyruvoyl-tetrahydropterin synthase-related protein [Candidatus Atelocyanobacterium thalassa]BDA40229.1 hypothetical protein CPARK_000106700 [cyanobacterium endosymbiont of Braarudosphaera bigelowii]